MAQLPTYKKMTPTYEGIAGITDVVIRQENITSQRINRFLDTAKTEFQAKAVEYATDKAVEDAIRNPITAEQLDQAMDTGGNPVESYLKGGTAYNEAITKVIGQQVAGELSIDLNKYNSDVLEQVRTGQIANSEEMLAKLKEPIQAQIEFFANIDPKQAQSYGSKATANAHNVYLQGVRIFEGQQQKQAEANAKTMIAQEKDNYNNFLKNYPDATNQQKEIYRQAIEKTAVDTSLSMTRNQLELTNILKAELKGIDDGYVIKDIAVAYTGNNVAEVINDLNKYDNIKKKYKGDVLSPDQYNLAEYYHNMNIEEQNEFKQKIASQLSIANAGQAELKREVNYNIKKSNQFLKFQQPIPQDIKDFVNKNIDEDSIEYKEWKITESFSDNIETYNQMPFVTQKNDKENVGLVDKLTAMNNRITDKNYQPSYEELKEAELLTSYVKNVQTQLTNDPVGTMLKRAGEYTPLDLSNPDILKEQVAERRALIGTYGPLYGMSESQFDQNIMTKPEVNSFVDAYRNGDGATRVAMLRMIDDSFGDSNSSALLQLVNAGLPTTAELSSYIGDPNVTERFLSFDDPDEQERLTKVATQKNTSYNEVSRAVANKLQGFSNMVMMQNPFNKSTATKKMANINDALTYYAINEMQSGKSMASAIEEATNLINNDFQIEDTYLIPKKYNGQPINADDVATKANRIKDIDLAKFNAVPFGSFLDIPEAEREAEFNSQLVENGRWVNTADGTGLMFVIVLDDGSFAPIENSNGENLQFNFNDTDMIIPTTDIDISAPKDETRFERIGKERRAERALKNKRDIRY